MQKQIYLITPAAPREVLKNIPLPAKAQITKEEKEFWSEVVAAKLAEVAAIVRYWLPERHVCAECQRRIK